MFMGKHGCLSVLSKLLEGVAKKNYIILKYVHTILCDVSNFNSSTCNLLRLCAESLTQFLKQSECSILTPLHTPWAPLKHILFFLIKNRSSILGWLMMYLSDGVHVLTLQRRCVAEPQAGAVWVSWWLCTSTATSQTDRAGTCPCGGPSSSLSRQPLPQVRTYAHCFSHNTVGAHSNWIHVRITCTSVCV